MKYWFQIWFVFSLIARIGSVLAFILTENDWNDYLKIIIIIWYVPTYIPTYVAYVGILYVICINILGGYHKFTDIDYRDQARAPQWTFGLGFWFGAWGGRSELLFFSHRPCVSSNMHSATGVGGARPPATEMLGVVSFVPLIICQNFHFVITTDWASAQNYRPYFVKI